MFTFFILTAIISKYLRRTSFKNNNERFYITLVVESSDSINYKCKVAIKNKYICSKIKCLKQKITGLEFSFLSLIYLFP